MMLNIAEIMNFVVPQIGIGIHLALSEPDDLVLHA